MDLDTWEPAGMAGRTALVTAGETAWGGACALKLARAGADIALCYLRDHEAAARAGGAVEALGRSCLALPADLRLESECRRAADRVLHRFGRLDMAALLPRLAPVGADLLSLPPARLDDFFLVPQLLLRAALPRLSRAAVAVLPVCPAFAPALAAALEARDVETELVDLEAYWR